MIKLTKNKIITKTIIEGWEYIISENLRFPLKSYITYTSPTGSRKNKNWIAEDDNVEVFHKEVVAEFPNLCEKPKKKSLKPQRVIHSRKSIKEIRKEFLFDINKNFQGVEDPEKVDKIKFYYAIFNFKVRNMYYRNYTNNIEINEWNGHLWGRNEKLVKPDLRQDKIDERRDYDISVIIDIRRELNRMNIIYSRDKNDIIRVPNFQQSW